MRVLVLYAHPLETSFQAALHKTVVGTLKRVGHVVDDCDLYADGFNPVLSPQERIDHYDTSRNRAEVQSYVERLLAADGLVLNFPVWNMGFPAILKGYFDRVFLPGVSFRVENGVTRPNLRNIRRLVAVTTYATSRWRAVAFGDSPRKTVKRVIRVVCHPTASCHYLALYDINRSSDHDRMAFLSRVSQRMERF